MDPFVLFFGFFAVVVVAGIGMVVWSLKNAPRLIAQADAAAVAKLTPYASSRGFAVLPGEGPLGNRTPARVRASVQGVELTIHHESKTTHRAHDGHFSESHAMVLEARAAHPLPVDLKVYQESAASGLIGALTGQADVQIGDPSFDPRFVVRATDPGGARALLDPSVRQALLAFPASPALHYDRGAIRLEWSASEPDPATFDAAIAVAAALGRPR
jgi:hypothetical protein